ncbi:putative pentatricopeptide repeat domain-containing protein [Zalerion maritima]|uniref:Pentatricopeptide repeat domain-containing protein n=1 Tax=Zalerion maritima TaxID=339359 RepID=A0AAD5RQP5_9PEZI|nr:putative pentatricopeptide repeat domain-containing protein [Zalerion maritima]
MSLGINALRRLFYIPTTHPALRASIRSRTGFRRLLSSSSTFFAGPPPAAANQPEHVNHPLVHGSNTQLGEALRELDLSEAELLATLDQYEQSAEKDGPATVHARTSASIDDGYPLIDISRVKPQRVYPETGSPVVAPFRRYPTRNETKASAQSHRKDMYAHLWGERNYFSGDWEKTYNNLANFTPYPTEWHSRVLEVYLNADQVKAFLHPEPGHSLWEIGQRTGAVLQLERNDDPMDSTKHCVILSGQESHLRKSIDEIVALLGEVRVKKRKLGEKYTPPPPAQQYPTEHLRLRRGYIRKTTGRTVDDFDPPPQWTKRSIEEYVGWIVTCVPSTEAQAVYVERKQEHQHRVVRKLVELLSGGPNGAPREILTTSTFKLALSYMGQRGTVFYKQLWSLFQFMQPLGIPYDAEVFNIMLENCAKSGNLYRFNKTLLVMHRQGFEPDMLTWQMLIRMIKAPLLKRKIVHDIRTRGLMRNPKDKANIAMEMVAHDLEHFIRSHRHTSHFQLRDFIAQQDAEYGDSKWLGLNTFKRIVETLSRFSLFEDCFHSIMYLARASDGGLQPSADAFNHILVHLLRQPGKFNRTFPKLAIKTIRAMEEVRDSFDAKTNLSGKGHAYKPNSKTFHLLFHLGYRLRLPNFMAVVWRYAAMRDLTTTWMRLKVTRYLVFGRTDRTNNTPVLLRSYVRRLFMDDVLARSLDQPLMAFLDTKRRVEVLQLAQLKDEPAVKYISSSNPDKTEEPEDPSAIEQGPRSISAHETVSITNATSRPRGSSHGMPTGLKRPELSELESRIELPPQGVDPPEAWHAHTSPGDLSMLSLWRSAASPTRRFDYDVWFRHGLAVAREYRHEYRDWIPKWPLSEALSYALGRDFQFRSCLEEFEAISAAVRSGKQRNGVSHAVWMKKNYKRLPTPLRIPIYNHHLSHLPYHFRFRSFGGDSNDVLQLHIGPKSGKKREKERKEAQRYRKMMKPYVDADEFSRLFAHIKSPEKNELIGWENLLMEHGHDVG